VEDYKPVAELAYRESPDCNSNRLPIPRER